MRRADREIRDFAAIVAIMRRCKVCHVALGGGEYPYVVPMNFGLTVEDGVVTLFFHGAREGKKHARLAKDNRAAFVMEDTHGIAKGPEVGAGECTMEFESAMGEGRLSYVTEPAAKRAALQTLLDQYGVREGEGYHFNEQAAAATAVLALKVERLSAKFRQVGQK